jgi:hypothetical protein
MAVDQQQSWSTSLPGDSDGKAFNVVAMLVAHQLEKQAPTRLFM